MYKKIALFLAIMILGGCAIKPKNIKSKSYLVTFKFANIKFSDVGFLNTGKNYTNIQVFSAGTPLIDLKIQNQVCVDYFCMGKSNFNEEYLSPSYPNKIMENILNGKPIFNSKNIIKTQDGFTQKLEDKNYKIIYKITQEKIYFKDFKNKILIKLKIIRN